MSLTDSDVSVSDCVSASDVTPADSIIDDTSSSGAVSATSAAAAAASSRSIVASELALDWDISGSGSGFIDKSEDVKMRRAGSFSHSRRGVGPLELLNEGEVMVGDSSLFSPVGANSGSLISPKSAYKMKPLAAGATATSGTGSGTDLTTGLVGLEPISKYITHFIFIHFSFDFPPLFLKKSACCLVCPVCCVLFFCCLFSLFIIVF